MRKKEIVYAGNGRVFVFCSVYMKMVNQCGYVSAQFGFPLVCPECKQIFSFSLPRTKKKKSERNSTRNKVNTDRRISEKEGDVSISIHQIPLIIINKDGRI